MKRDHTLNLIAKIIVWLEGLGQKIQDYRFASACRAVKTKQPFHTMYVTKIIDKEGHVIATLPATTFSDPTK